MRKLSLNFPSLGGLFLTIILLISISSVGITAQDHYDVIIRNGRVLDGSGNPWFHADIAIRGNRIAALGNKLSGTWDKEIDASGLYVVPGFIDTHSHAAGGLASADRSHAQPLLAQGVTTVVVNPDGGGPVDLARQRQALTRDGLGVNVIQLAPHGSIRQAVMGMANRLTSDGELEQMKNLLRQAMEEGAFGLSSGPFYQPGSYADTRELIELAKISSQYGGIYTSHIRDESDYTIGLIAAVEEVIEIAREAHLPGVVTHIKALGPNVWGYSMAVVEKIKKAREEGVEIYTDQYPYLASSTGLSAALVPAWALAGGEDSLRVRFSDSSARSKIKRKMIENLARRGGADRILIRSYAPDRSVVGKKLSEIASTWNLDAIDAATEMLKLDSPGIISFNMAEKDLRMFMVQSWNITCSDGAYPEWGSGRPHPRAFGTFPRKIRKYVLEEEVLDLAAAIKSMTGLPAQAFRIPGRGLIREGALADLVVFDLDHVQDQATFTEPFQLSEGMVHVFVNGKAAVMDGKFSGSLSGQVLRRRLPSH